MVETIRLNKYLANRGLCSRRDVKLFVKEHNVCINGEKVKEAGVRLNPVHDVVTIDGETLHMPKLVYYLVNKPKGIISTTDDEYGRKNVTELIPTTERVYPVGRLDKDTTGLILLTNDGELTNLLTHPSYHVDKTYLLTINGKIHETQLKAFRNGVLLPDGITSPAKVRIVKENTSLSQIEMTIHEGKNRQIRRMCETVGVTLIDLQRTKLGPLAIGKLKEGAYRVLEKHEVALLRNVAIKGTREL